MLFKNINILNKNFEVERNMYLGVKDERINYIGKEKPTEDYGEEYDGHDNLLMPGFYNAHAHSPMTLTRGYGENLSLQDWLNKKIFPFEAHLDSNAVYWGTTLAMMESLRFGIVATSDMYFFIDDMVEAMVNSGAKNNISRGITNFTGEDLKTLPQYNEVIRDIKNYHNMENERIKIDTSLHGEYTSDEGTARTLAAMTKEMGVNIQVHVSETKLEHEECKGRHNGMTPVEYLNDCGIFDMPATAAHCVWIEGNDFNILKEKGVTVATNPVSNLKLASGICDVNRVMENGINLAIGTDGVGSNNNLNFFEEIKTMALLGKIKTGDPSKVTPAQALEAATIGGAKSMGRFDCGTIEIGKKADLILVNTNLPNMQPVHAMANNLVYSATGSDIIMTMVDGKVLYNKGEFLTMDAEKAIFQAKKATEKILGKM